MTRHSQCTGAPAYQGEQDQDPHNATDCNQAGSAATRFVRAAELQAFEDSSGAGGGGGGGNGGGNGNGNGNGGGGDRDRDSDSD